MLNYVSEHVVIVYVRLQGQRGCHPGYKVDKGSITCSLSHQVHQQHLPSVIANSLLKMYA